jgi:hypothetical protein
MSSQLVPQKPGSSSGKSQPRINSAFKQLWSMHWWMAVCYLLLFVGGVWMVRMPEDTALQDHAYTLHKSLGVLTMALRNGISIARLMKIPNFLQEVGDLEGVIELLRSRAIAPP